MRRIVIFGMLLIFSVLAACKPMGRIVTHALNPRYMSRTNDRIALSHFADLKGNGRELMITVEAVEGINRQLRVYDHDGKIIFQYDTRQHIRGIRSLKASSSGPVWLFYTYAVQDSVWLSAIQFDWKNPDNHPIRHFEPVTWLRDPAGPTHPNVEFSLHPEILADIDKDGKKELICRLSSTVPGYNRGLYGFDFATGNIKWKQQTGANITDVLMGDFDASGSQEIIFATRTLTSFANDDRPFNNSGAWLGVLNSNGDILFAERQFEGTGETRLMSLPNSELKATTLFAINNTWGSRRTMNSAMSLVWTGSSLVLNRAYYTQNSFERSDDHPNLSLYQARDATRLVLIEKGQGLTAFDGEMNKLELKCDDFVSEILDYRDIDLDGKTELLVRRPDRAILILDADLNKRAELKDPVPNAERVSIRFVGRGSGMSAGLAACGDNQIIYYGFYPIAWHKLVWRFISTHAIYLTILLTLFVAFLIWYTIYNWQSIYTIMPDLRTAVLYLKDDDRLLYCNPYFLELVRAQPGKQKRSLKELSPTLSSLLMDFKASGNKLQNHELAMGEDYMAGIYRVSFFRRSNPVYRFLVIIIPVPTVNAAEKILWADTARRLSHHVRRHITNVILALPRLTDEGIDAAERKEFQQIISSEVEKIRVFTHSFQRFSELRDHDLRQHDVLPLLEHVLDHLHIPEGVKLIRNIPMTPLFAFLDPIRFEEALANLLNNALDAMAEGGYLQITLKIVAPHESPNSALTVLIEIEDSGSGIPEKYLEEIWKPFFTTKQSGTGIGLPESRKIVESMGGMITLHSEEKVGTTVSIWLRMGEAEG